MDSVSIAISEIKKDPTKRLKVVKVLRNMMISYQFLNSRGIKDENLERLIIFLAENMRSERDVEN